MSVCFTIPADATAADSMAGELGEVATATEWKRAAIVYARVRVQDGQGRPSQVGKVSSDLLSPAEYALLGIHGLRSKRTVRAYWRAWDNAVAEGLAQPVLLGDNVNLPDAEWSDYYGGSTQPTTPPYYVPHPTAGQPLPDELALRGERGANLGLGSCPPTASDLESGERVQRRNGGGGHRGKLPSWMALLRVRSAIANISDLEGDDADKQTEICRLIDEVLASIQPAPESN